MRLGNFRLRRQQPFVCVSFASKWLAPRLGRLRASCHPFDVNMDVTDVNVDLHMGHVDAAIRYGFGRYPNAMSERSLEETVTPVCSPDYLAGCGGLEQPGQVLRTNLLHEVGMMADWPQRLRGNWACPKGRPKTPPARRKTQPWLVPRRAFATPRAVFWGVKAGMTDFLSASQWFDLAGLGKKRPPRGPSYSHGSMAVEAAIRGEGVALARSTLVHQHASFGT